MQLKTLKDIEWEAHIIKEGEEFPLDIIVTHAQLRKEAIKHIKHNIGYMKTMKKRFNFNKEEMIINESIRKSVIFWIETFFNISKENLKNKNEYL